LQHVTYQYCHPFPSQEDHPCLLQHFDQLEAAAAGKMVAVFLDYDGTLTPIVNNPDAAFMTEHMREAVRAVASVFPTAIISGRGREKVERFVQLEELYYAGSHGMDIAAPTFTGDGVSAGVAFQPASEYEPLMHQVGRELEAAIKGITGSAVENNKYCVSVHFRNCAVDQYAAVVSAVEGVVTRHACLHITRGRKVLEVRPQIEWDKGKALLHLLQMLGLSSSGDVFCLYIGDDRTDEDAFKILKDNNLGAGILVSSKVKNTEGSWTLRDPGDVAAFLQRLVAWGQTEANVWHARGGCNGWRMAESVRRCTYETAMAALTCSQSTTRTLSAAARLAHKPVSPSARPPLPPRPPLR
jgi:trehalose 6-phosphate phosphatase